MFHTLAKKIVELLKQGKLQKCKKGLQWKEFINLINTLHLVKTFSSN